MYPCILPGYPIHRLPWSYLGCICTIYPRSYYLLGPACSISTILSELYLLNIVSPSCNIILAEIHMQDVILTSHLESLLEKKVKASILPEKWISLIKMSTGKPNQFTWELVSRTSTWTVRLNHLHKLSLEGSVAHSTKMLFSYFQLETLFCISRMETLAKAISRMSIKNKISLLLTNDGSFLTC